MRIERMDHKSRQPSEFDSISGFSFTFRIDAQHDPTLFMHAEYEAIAKSRRL